MASLGANSSARLRHVWIGCVVVCVWMHKHKIVSLFPSILSNFAACWRCCVCVSCLGFVTGCLTICLQVLHILCLALRIEPELNNLYFHCCCRCSSRRKEKVLRTYSSRHWVRWIDKMSSQEKKWKINARRRRCRGECTHCSCIYSNCSSRSNELITTFLRLDHQADTFISSI